MAERRLFHVELASLVESRWRRVPLSYLEKETVSVARASKDLACSHKRMLVVDGVPQVTMQVTMRDRAIRY